MRLAGRSRSAKPDRACATEFRASCSMDPRAFALESEDGGHARSTEPAGETVTIFGGALPIVVGVWLCPSGPKERKPRRANPNRLKIRVWRGYCTRG